MQTEIKLEDAPQSTGDEKCRNTIWPGNDKMRTVNEKNSQTQLFSFSQIRTSVQGEQIAQLHEASATVSENPPPALDDLPPRKVGPLDTAASLFLASEGFKIRNINTILDSSNVCRVLFCLCYMSSYEPVQGFNPPAVLMRAMNKGGTKTTFLRVASQSQQQISSLTGTVSRSLGSLQDKRLQPESRVQFESTPLSAGN